MKILITGASGLLGRYLLSVFEHDTIVALPRSESLSLAGDFTPGDIAGLDPDAEIPFDLVVHAAASSAPDSAMAVNLDGTVKLLKALSKLPRRPKALTFISCWSVYSPDAGELIDEAAPLNPAGEVGRSKMLAERQARLWADAAGVPLTILRPAMMFGSGMKGEAHEMFLDVVKGRYIHVRGQEGRLSIVTALDVARAVKLTAAADGIFNVADDNPARWIDLAEAMSANAGARKRMATLPAQWADLAWKYCKMIPAVARSLSPEVRERRSASLTLSCERLAGVAEWKPFDTLAVLAGNAPCYPYQDRTH